MATASIDMILPPELLEALAASLSCPKDALQCETVGGGLINQSFRISVKGSEQSWILQSVNRHVFPRPDWIEENYSALYAFAQQTKKIRIPVPLQFGDSCHFIDHAGGFWRAAEWIPNSITIDKVETVEQARSVAENFARFTQALSHGFDATLLHPVIPRFHDLRFRFVQFRESLDRAIPERKKEMEYLSSQLLDRIDYVSLYDRIRNSPDDFPVRVMHHDAKISNILFDARTGQSWGPIDLDTVMPGYFFSDLGDMVRSLAGTADENEADIGKLRIREDYYAALTESYAGVMNDEWTREEHHMLHSCGLLMIYMQALRFLSDHLTGDAYYRIQYPGQNGQRARNQFRLLEALEIHCRQQYGFSV